MPLIAMDSKKVIEFSKQKISIGLLGTMVAFLVTNYFSYISGVSTQRAVLIDTMSKYRSFYEDVHSNSKVACDAKGKLRGLYLSQFNSMLPVIKGEIEAPYDNPCPSPSPPLAPKIALHFGNSWEKWEDFINDPSPKMTFKFPEGTLLYPIDEEWKSAIVKWRTELIELKAKTKTECASGEDCRMDLELVPLTPPPA